MTSALVLAGGGITGIAWESGVLAGLAAGGIDPLRWNLVVGTSAGAYVGARLTVDGSPDPLFAVQTSGNDAAEEDGLRILFGRGFVRAVRLSRRRSLRWIGTAWVAAFVATTLVRHAARHGWRSTLATARTLAPGQTTGEPGRIAATMGAIADLKRKDANRLIEHWEHALGAGRAWPPTRLVATALDTSDGSRILFDCATGVSLVAAVAASTCLPGLLAPVPWRARRYMDGGIVSPANADVAAGHDEVWILCPSDSGSLDREVADLREARSVVHLIQPSDAARMVMPHGLGELDPANRLAAATAGFADGLAAAAAVNG